ncbi:hypothetical protein INS49_014773 [Diaporthe citri]|uniref:uncharacterized protein n=1 Tax=Diaporthe citri TaxID=83186 RepID=UPI001C7EC445|nr:uncharacterized protein INS49_014773 [Diaporthe citri]KAG6356898.1 hypothetical protein INS49_014773 [Diaporthe citri]
MADGPEAHSDLSSTDTSSYQGSIDEVDQEHRMQGGNAAEEEIKPISHVGKEPDHASWHGEDASPESAHQTDIFEDVKGVDEAKKQWEDVLEYMQGEKPPEYDAQGLVTLWDGRQDSISGPQTLVADLFDVVVIHGFWGARRPPWKNPGSGNSSWVHDQGSDQCRKVMSFGYDPMSMLSDTGAHEVIKNVAMKLLDDIKEMKESSSQMRRLMFIAHDIGGIIVKHALAHAQLNPRAYGVISDTARLLIFYGCPHRASDAMDMEQRLSRFMYRRTELKSPVLRTPTSATKSLAKAIMAINDSYFLSKQMFRSYTISIFSEAGSGDIDEVFDKFCGTLGSPFEFRVAGGLNLDDDCGRIRKCTDHTIPFVAVDENRFRDERLLLSLASPVLPLRTSDGLDHPYAWISDNKKYQSWRNQQKPELLYLNGGPDARLASEYVFYDLDKLNPPRSRQIALYFSFDRYDVRKDDALDMMATFLAQIMGHSPLRSMNALNIELEQCRTSRGWHYTDAFRLFQFCRHWSQVPNISCVLANFDECEPVSRKAFLDFFLYVSQTREWHWKVVVTNTQPEALAQELSDLPSVYLDASAREAANEKRVDQDLQAIAGLDSDVRDLVIKQISFNKQWPPQRSVRDIIGSTDRASLESVVEKILDDVPDRELTLRALTWILHATRPLTHLELATAVTLGSGVSGADVSQSSGKEADETLEKLQAWLIGILVFENNTATLSTHRIRELLMAKSKNQSEGPHLWDSLERNPHAVIGRTCLAYLATPAVQQSLERLYGGSLNEETLQARRYHHTGLQEYAVQFWIHHVSHASHGYDPKEDVAAFITSGAVTNWSKGYWSLANPITRSPQPFETLYPILAGRGLVGLAEKCRVGDKEISDGLGEAYANGCSQNMAKLLCQRQHSTDTLNNALTCAGAWGDGTAWTELIDHIRKEYPGFPWKDQGAQVVRASGLGLSDVLEQLLELGCPADEKDRTSEEPYPLMPLFEAIISNKLAAATLLLDHGASPNREAGGVTALHLAAYYGHQDMVTLLKHHGVDLNVQNTNFCVPVYVACLWGNTKALEALLGLGANPNLKASGNQDEPGWSPLTCAVQEQNVGCVRALLGANADPDIFGPSGTPLWYAVANGSFEICQLLLEHGASPNSLLNPLPILVHAMNSPDSESSFDIVKLLLEKGAEINAATREGTTALARSCWSHRQHKHSIVRYLLQHGADVNLPGRDGCLPIHISVQECDVEMLRVLLDQKNVEVNAETANGCTPLIYAARCSDHNEELVRILLENGADPNKYRERKNSALVAAVVGNHTEVVNLLLQHKAQIDPPDELIDGWEPLERAIVNGHANIVRILADAGANVNRRFSTGFTLVHQGVNSNALGALLEFRPTLDLRTDDGRTPLHYIEESMPLENIKLLVRAGSEVNVKDRFDSTPLVEALMYGHAEAAKYLLSKNADTTIISPFFGGPLHAACSSGLVEIVEYLIDRGADVNLSVQGSGGTPLSSVFMFPASGDDSGEGDDCKTKLIHILLGAGANVEASNSLFGSISGAAAWGGEVAHLRILAARGSNFAGSDISGRTPLHIAAARGRKEMASFIMDSGGKATSKDKIGRSVLSWAAQGGNTALLDNLPETTGNDAIDDADLDGWTPLCWAARAIADEGAQPGHLKMIKELLHRGADRSVRSRLPGKEYTPADIAWYHGCDQEVLELLAPSSEDRPRSGGQESTGPNELGDMPDLAINNLKRSRSTTILCSFCHLLCRGLEYNCKTCPDYDLCYKCFNSKDKIHPADHEFGVTGPEFELASVHSDSRSPSPAPSSSLMRGVARNLVAAAPAVDMRRGDVVNNVGCGWDAVVEHTPDGKVASWDALTAEQDKRLFRFLLFL